MTQFGQVSITDTREEYYPDALLAEHELINEFFGKLEGQ